MPNLQARDHVGKPRHYAKQLRQVDVKLVPCNYDEGKLLQIRRTAVPHFSSFKRTDVLGNGWLNCGHVRSLFVGVMLIGSVLGVGDF